MGPAGPTAASTFTVNPIQVFLSDASRSTIVTLQNTSPEPLRVQLSAFVWDQGPAGEMRLQATTEVVFFPKLLTVAAREERKIRVGLSVPAGPVEKTYRLFVEELAPLERPRAGADAPQVRLLSRVGIPVFLQPARRLAVGRIDALTVHRGRLGFRLANGGTVHILPQAIRVTGRDRSGQPVLDRPVDGWYVLAGGTRLFDLEIPRAECVRLQSVVVEVKTAQTVLTERTDTTPGACDP